MKKLPIILVSALFICITATYGQHSFGIKMNAGLSQLNFTENDYFKNYYTLSGQAGLAFNYKISPRSLIGTELLMMLVRGKQEQPVNWFGPWGPPDNLLEDKSTLHRNVTFIGVPVYYGLEFNKLTVSIGVNALYALSSGSEHQWHLIFSDKPEQKEKVDVGSLNISRFAFAPRAGLAYKITEKIDLDCNFTLGQDKYYNFHQLTFGFQYKLFNKG